MLHDLILETRSYRSFDSSMQIPHETLVNWVDNARLAPSARNAQPLKYKIVDSAADVEKIMPLTGWAGALKDRQLPPPGHHPTAFIIICHDTTVIPNPTSSENDVGIAAMTVMLSATEDGFGGCIIGSFNSEKIGELLRIPEKYVPVLLLALGKPDETVILCEPKDGSVVYFRDDHNLHFVPKRRLDDILID